MKCLLCIPNYIYQDEWFFLFIYLFIYLVIYLFIYLFILTKIKFNSLRNGLAAEQNEPLQFTTVIHLLCMVQK